jgi:hypothetical protein
LGAASVEVHRVDVALQFDPLDHLRHPKHPYL